MARLSAIKICLHRFLPCPAELNASVCSCVSPCALLCSAPELQNAQCLAYRVVRASTDPALFRLLCLIVDFLEAEGYGIKTRVEGLGDICYA